MNLKKELIFIDISEKKWLVVRMNAQPLLHQATVLI